MSKRVGPESDWTDSNGNTHSLKLLKRNVVGDLNGYICNCGKLFVAPSKAVAEMDHTLWIKREEGKRNTPRCVYRPRMEYF